VDVLCFIPARAGSKRIVHKNGQLVGGRSLLHRAMDGVFDASCESDHAIACMVSTDDGALAAHALDRARRHMLDTYPFDGQHSMGDVDAALVGEYALHQRPPALASDHAQIEAAMAHAWTRLERKPDVLAMLQPTSVFRKARHILEALRLLEVTGADSVIGVTASHDSHFAGRLKPREVGNGLCAGEPWFEWQPHAPMGHDRPRTQDLPPRGTDNGSLYVTRRKAWETSELRTSGVTVALPMSRIEGWDIDTIEDLEAARAMAEGMGL
jgi:CMP-N,N'-diacetyllegionaminic acid synthase